MIRTALVAASLLTFSAPASAAVIDLTTLVGVWDVQNEVLAIGDFYSNSYFAPVPITLWFTDLFVQEDSYSVFINGNFWFDSAFIPDDGTYLTDPLAAIQSGKYSAGSLGLQAGDTVSFAVLTLPNGYSDGTIAVTAVASAVVPEPASWALMIAGFGMVGGAMRRQWRVAA